MTGRSPNRYIAQGNTLGVSELSNLHSERAAGGSSLAILPIPFALSERRIAIPFLPRALPWAVFPLGFQPVIAHNHCCCTIYCALFLLGFQPVIARNHGCSTILQTIFLLVFYSAISCDLGCCTVLCALFFLDFQPVIAHNHGYYIILCAIFLFCFQPAIARNYGCSTVPWTIFLFRFQPAIAARWMVSKNRGILLPWREKHFCFFRVFRCKTSSFDGGIVGRKREATIFSILYTYFFCRLLLFLYLYHIKRKTT